MILHKVYLCPGSICIGLIVECRKNAVSYNNLICAISEIYGKSEKFIN